MSLDIIFPKSVKNIPKRKYIHPNRIIKKRMSEEGKFDTTIFEMLKHPTHLQLEFVSNHKPRIQPIKGNHDMQKILLAKELNNFRKSYYDFERKNLKIKKIFKKYESELHNKNNFLEKYKIFKNKIDNKYFNDRKFLNELKGELEKKNIKVPDIDLNKNLFDKNLLLVKQENIEKFLNYQLGSEKGDNKAYNYISKLNKLLSNKGNRNILGFDLFEEENELFHNKPLRNEHLLKNSNDISKDEILSPEKQIKKINETLKNLNEIDKFLNSEEKENFQLINNEQFQNTSKLSQKKFILRNDFQKTFLRLPNTTMNKSFHSVNDSNIISKNKNRLNKSLTLVNNNNSIFNKMNNSRKSLFFNNSYENLQNSNEKDLAFNKSDYNSMDKKDLIKIKKVYLNKKNNQNINNSYSIDSKMSTLYPNTSYDKFFQGRKTINRPKALTLLPKSKSVLIDKQSELENVYDKVINSGNSQIYNNMMKNYLSKKNTEDNLSEFTVFDIFNNYFKAHKSIFKGDYLGINIQLKRESMMDLQSIDKLKIYSKSTNTQMKSIKNKMEKMMNKISFQFKG